MKLVIISSLLLIGAALALAGSPRYFLQLTDIHIDPLYRPWTDTTQACHRETGPAGPFGNRLWCDTPEATVDYTFYSFLNKLVTGPNPPDFVVWTGDNARHDADRIIIRTAEEVLGLNWNIAQRMSSVFSGNTQNSKKPVPVIPSIGNNDVSPHDQLQWGPNDILSNLTGNWLQWLTNDESVESMKTGGFYKTSVSPTLDVYSINTMYFYFRNLETPDCNVTGSLGLKHLQWLNQSLAQTTNRGAKAYLTGHVPPSSMWYPACYQMYVTMTRAYHMTILGHLYAHTHADQFFILREAPQREPAGVVNVAPSIEPSYNPAARIYFYDADNTNALLDYTQFYVDIDTANKQGPPEMVPEYSWLQTYQKQNFSLGSWVQLEEQIQTDERVRALYTKLRYVSSGFVPPNAHELNSLKHHDVIPEHMLRLMQEATEPWERDAHIFSSNRKSKPHNTKNRI